jgi:sporulation integral membrane protein YlbJ
MVKRKNRWTDWAVAVAVILCVTGLLFKPAESTASARDGLLLCFDIIIPSLFPFFVLSVLIVDLGIARYLGRALEKIMLPLFNVNGACGTALAMGFIGVYPVGARTALSLYEKGLCSKEETERLLSFCNNSGPAFIFGVVGSGVFASSRIGIILYIAHMTASITVGMIFRFYKRKARPLSVTVPDDRQTIKLSTAFTHSVTSSFHSILNICAFVIFFTVAVRMLFSFGILPVIAGVIGTVFAPVGFGENEAAQLLTGLLEMTSGLWSLQGAAPSLGRHLSMAAFMLGWAGISVHAQVLSFLSQSGLAAWTYITGKLLHGLFSALYTYIAVRLMSIDEPAVTVMADQISGIANMSFTRTLTVTMKVVLILIALIIITALVALLRRKRYT